VLVAVAKLKETPILPSLPLHVVLVAVAVVKLKETPILLSLPLQLLLPSSLLLLPQFCWVPVTPSNITAETADFLRDIVTTGTM
jgi:hypothetical protein